MIVSRLGRGRGRSGATAPDERFAPGPVDAVLRRVVRPVVADLVGARDLEQLAVGWDPAPARPRALLVTLVARGTFWSTVIWREGDEDRTWAQVAGELSRDLGRWVRAEAV